MDSFGFWSVCYIMWIPGQTNPLLFYTKYIRFPCSGLFKQRMFSKTVFAFLTLCSSCYSGLVVLKQFSFDELGGLILDLHEISFFIWELVAQLSVDAPKRKGCLLDIIFLSMLHRCKCNMQCPEILAPHLILVGKNSHYVKCFIRRSLTTHGQEDCFYDLPYNTGYQIFVLRLRKIRDKIMKCTLYICRYIL